MANGRNKGRRGDSGRDPGGFIALPWSVLDCSAYAELSHPARSLLIEFSRQIGPDNNGQLVASRNYLARRGWNSARVIDKAKHELIAAGFIYETVKGGRPKRASWFAVTWRALVASPKYDEGAAAGFERSAYLKNASLIPTVGSRVRSIGPTVGAATPASVPAVGPIRAVFQPIPVPTLGHLLEMPSAGARTTAARPARSPQPAALALAAHALDTDIEIAPIPEEERL